MTPQEVALATNGEARVVREKLPREGRKARVGNRSTLENELTTFKVAYYFDHTGLTRITLDPKFEDCELVLRELDATYGAPIEYLEQIILRTFTWHDEANGNMITVMHSTADICTVNFTRLAAMGDEGP